MSAPESRPATAREVFAAHPQMLSAEGAYIPERDDAPEPMTVEQIRAELTEEFVGWLVKKAREHRAQGPQYAKQADVIGRLASKVARDAVRPDNLRSLPAQGGPEDVPGLLAAVERCERMTGQSCPAGIHADWLVDSPDHHACPWCELERVRRRAVLAEECRVANAGALSEAADQVAARDDEIGRLSAELAARPSRAEVLREEAAFLREIATPVHGRERTEHERGQMYAAERLEQRAAAAEEKQPVVAEVAAAAAARLRGLLAPSPMQQLVTRQRAEGGGDRG